MKAVLPRHRACVCRVLACGVALLLGGAGLRAVDPLIRLPDRSISRTGQFVVYCDDARLRSAVNGRVEELKAAWLDLIGLRDGWRFPVVVYLAPPATIDPAGPPSTVRMYATEEGFKVQVDVRLDGDLARARFTEQILRALLLEAMHRGDPSIAGGEDYREPPAWLVEGCAAWIGQRDRADAADLFRTLLGAGRPLGLGEFLDQNPASMDSTSAKLYRGLSLALVQLLIDLPGGRPAFGRYVAGLGSAQGAALDTLRAAFPTLGENAAAAEKWWALSLARLSAADRFRGLSLLETEAELEALQTLTLPGEDGQTERIPLAEFPKFAKRRDARAAVVARIGDLLALRTRAHPLYVPVIEEYQKALGLLARGKDKGVAESLDLAASYRADTTARVDAIADYLNWYEVTQIVTPSRLFDGYLDTARALEAPPPKRDDAISKYLDTVERALEF